MEIERKFLVGELPELGGFKYHKIEQGYLSKTPVVRVRKQDDDYYMTYKGAGLMAREEYNLPLTEESFYHLLDKADGRKIKKTRYLIPYGEYTIELDVFEGDHAPLIMAEVEFPSIEEAENFQPPSWFIEDVTQNPKYHNVNMV